MSKVRVTNKSTWVCCFSVPGTFHMVKNENNFIVLIEQIAKCSNFIIRIRSQFLMSFDSPRDFPHVQLVGLKIIARTAGTDFDFKRLQAFTHPRETTLCSISSPPISKQVVVVVFFTKKAYCFSRMAKSLLQYLLKTFTIASFLLYIRSSLTTNSGTLFMQDIIIRRLYDCLK